MLYDGPLAVMINRFSASAAEIAAAALQDYGRAIIVGDTSTHGKGTVQNLNPLRPILQSATNDPGTRQDHHPEILPGQRRLHPVEGRRAGHHPAGRAELRRGHRRNFIGKSVAMGHDSHESRKYDKLNLVAAVCRRACAKIPTRASRPTRISITSSRTSSSSKNCRPTKPSRSMNAEQIKEREANQARQKARDQERRRRPPSGMKIYEITVENAGPAGTAAGTGCNQRRRARPVQQPTRDCNQRWPSPGQIKIAAVARPEAE